MDRPTGPPPGEPTRARPGHGRRWLWAGGAAALLAGIAAVAIGYFGVLTLFIDDVVDEAGPRFDSGAVADAADGDDARSPASGAGDRPGGAPADGAPADEPPAESTPSVMTLAIGMFDGVGRYSGAGTATVLGDGSEQRFVRFEDDFSTSNGPDLLVYLGTGSGSYGDPTEYVELGRLRGNIGSQNYEIPAVHPETGEPIDLARFDHVAVWCKRFDATFAIARLA